MTRIITEKKWDAGYGHMITITVADGHKARIEWPTHIAEDGGEITAGHHCMIDFEAHDMIEWYKNNDIKTDARPPMMVAGMLVVVGDQEWVEATSKVAHIDHDGMPACGARVSKCADRPERWDYWNNITRSKRSERGVWIPAFAAPRGGHICKRCAAVPS